MKKSKNNAPATPEPEIALSGEELQREIRRLAYWLRAEQEIRRKHGLRG